MRARFTEESVLLSSALKWFVLSSFVGTLVGVATAAFIHLLNWSTALTGRHPLYFLFLPVALFASAWLVDRFAPEAEGHGTEKVIEAVHRRAGRIAPAVVPIKLLATIVTLAFGGSAGKEGPCAQIGAGLSSSFADLFRFDDEDRRKLVICGISAGFAAVFGTPIAGAIFGVEVLFVGSLLYEVLMPSFVAGIIGYQTSSALGITYFHGPVAFSPAFSELFFMEVALAGAFFGLCAFLLVESMRMGELFAGRVKISRPLKGLVGGAVLVGVSLFFSTQYLGLGLPTIQSSLEGAAAPWYAFLLKMFCTSVTLNFGGSGGIVTPIFFIGATSGVFFAKLFGLGLSTFAAIGMVGLLAGAANTPIAASIMAIELFGPKIAPYAAVACVVSFLVTGHRSVYPSQVLSIRKSPSIQVQLGGEVKSAETQVHLRRKTVSGVVAGMAGILLRLFKNQPSRKP